MKTSIILFFALAVILSSCGVIGTDQFGKQKYTNFKKGKGGIVKKENLLKNKTKIVENNPSSTTPQELVGTGIIPVVIQPTLSPVVVTTSTPTPTTKLDRSIKPTHFRFLSKGTTNSAGGSVNDILMILLCIFIPPLAVYLIESTTTRFWITLVCWIIGGGFLFSTYVYIGGLWLLAIILAFLAFFGK